jgi:hypothetical protein
MLSENGAGRRPMDRHGLGVAKIFHRVVSGRRIGARVVATGSVGAFYPLPRGSPLVGRAQTGIETCTGAARRQPENGPELVS